MTSISNKSHIGYEDIEWGDITETFKRKTTTGGEITLHKVPDVYGGVDLLNYLSTIQIADIKTKSPWVDVRAFGAKGDGITDDTAAITAAYTILANGLEASNQYGGILFFPRGIYNFSALDFSFPTQMRHLVYLVGAGEGAKSLGTANTVLRCTGAGIAIKLGRAICKSLRLETTTATHGIYYTAGNTDSHVENIMVNGFSQYGLWWTGFSGEILNSKFGNNATNIFLSGNAFSIKNCIVEDWTTSGIAIDNCTNVNILGNTIETGTGPAIIFETNPSSVINIMGNYFENVTAVTNPDGQIRMNDQFVDFSTIAGNYFNLSTKANMYAVCASKMRYAKIFGNKVANPVGDNYYFSGNCVANSFEDSQSALSTNLTGVQDALYYKSIAGIGASLIRYLQGRMMFDEWQVAGGEVPQAEIHTYGLVNGTHTPIIIQNRGATPSVQIKAQSGTLTQNYELGVLKFTRGGTVNDGKFSIRLNKSGVETDMIESDNTYMAVGDGAWNGIPLKLGAYYIWIDATGTLRMKSGAPANDLDGNVVIANGMLTRGLDDGTMILHSWSGSDYWSTQGNGPDALGIIYNR